jgi:hypothetical protein
VAFALWKSKAAVQCPIWKTLALGRAANF